MGAANHRGPPFLSGILPRRRLTISQVLLEGPTSRLTRFVEQMSRGEEVIIGRDGTLVVKMVPLSEEKSTEEPISHFGNTKDILIYMADDFDAPLEDFKDYM